MLDMLKSLSRIRVYQGAHGACSVALAVSLLAAVTPQTSAQSSRVDPTFDPGTGAEGGIVETVLPQRDGKVLVCGDFTSFNGVSQGYIARLNANGSVDRTFRAGPGYWVRHMALQSDGKIVIGGFFTNVDGVKRNRIARLNSDGSLDVTFDPGLGAETKIVEGDDKDPFVFAVAAQPDDKILIAGNFRTYNGTPSFGIARLNPDGSLDTSFKVGAGLNSWGRFLLLLPNDQILATGWFTSYDNHPYNRMVRLNSDGSADTTFNPNFGDKTAIYGAVLLPDGKLIAGGHSVNEQGLFHQEFARLNPDGTFDTSYLGRSNEKTETYYLQPDGKLIIGGYFSMVNGVARNGLARLNADGTLDESFKAEADNFVWTIHGQNDGKLLVCGGFYHIDGIPRRGVARLLISDGGTAAGGTNVASPRIQQPTMSRGSFRMKTLTVAGHEYVLQYRTLESDRWNSLPALTGDDTVKDFVDPDISGSARRLYRILVR